MKNEEPWQDSEDASFNFLRHDDMDFLSKSTAAIQEKTSETQNKTTSSRLLEVMGLPQSPTRNKQKDSALFILDEQLTRSSAAHDAHNSYDHDADKSALNMTTIHDWGHVPLHHTDFSFTESLPANNRHQSISSDDGGDVRSSNSSTAMSTFASMLLIGSSSSPASSLTASPVLAPLPTPITSSSSSSSLLSPFVSQEANKQPILTSTTLATPIIDVNHHQAAAVVVIKEPAVTTTSSTSSSSSSVSNKTTPKAARGPSYSDIVAFRASNPPPSSPEPSSSSSIVGASSSLATPIVSISLPAAVASHPAVDLSSIRSYSYQVQFKRTKKFFFISSSSSSFDRPILIGDFVLVEGDRGDDLGLVISRAPVDSGAQDNAKPPTVGFRKNPQFLQETRHVLRHATDVEKIQLAAKLEEETSAMRLCREKVVLRELPMRLIDAEFQFDKRKLTYYFEAERRIDFRELVRDLFSQYKTRIWMQQVDDGFLNELDPTFVTPPLKYVGGKAVYSSETEIKLPPHGFETKMGYLNALRARGPGDMSSSSSSSSSSMANTTPAASPSSLSLSSSNSMYQDNDINGGGDSDWRTVSSTSSKSKASRSAKSSSARGRVRSNNDPDFDGLAAASISESSSSSSKLSSLSTSSSSSSDKHKTGLKEFLSSTPDSSIRGPSSSSSSRGQPSLSVDVNNIKSNNMMSDNLSKHQHPQHVALNTNYQPQPQQVKQLSLPNQSNVFIPPSYPQSPMDQMIMFGMKPGPVMMMNQQGHQQFGRSSSASDMTDIMNMMQPPQQMSRSQTGMMLPPSPMINPNMAVYMTPFAAQQMMLGPPPDNSGQQGVSDYYGMQYQQMGGNQQGSDGSGNNGMNFDYQQQQRR